MPLYEHIAHLSGNDTSKMVMPVPSFNVINGGSHAGNKLPIQEFMILPVGAPTFADALRMDEGGELRVDQRIVGRVPHRAGGAKCGIGLYDQSAMDQRDQPVCA